MSNITEIPDVASSRTFHQLGILVLDGSGSMQHYIGDGNRPLADNVNVSVRDFLGFFKNSSIKNNFSIAVVTFDDNATVHTPITPLADIDDYADYRGSGRNARWIWRWRDSIFTFCTCGRWAWLDGDDRMVGV